jgi:hypothetical protein
MQTVGTFSDIRRHSTLEFQEYGITRNGFYLPERAAGRHCYRWYNMSLAMFCSQNDLSNPLQQSGIGSWLAAYLHARGFRRALCGRREKEGQAIASSIDASGKSGIFVQCDVSSSSSQANPFQIIWKCWGRLDVLVANTGCVCQPLCGP